MADRKLRAIALTVFAITAGAIASVFYLRPSTPTPKPVAATSVDRNLVTNDIVTYKFVSPTAGWAMVVLSGPSNRLGESWLFATVDGAKHWRQQLQFNNGQLGRAPFGMSFVDETNGFVLIRGFPDQLYRTTDGGSHWVPVHHPSAGAESIQFVDRNNGWLVSAPKIYETNDSGLNWVALPTIPVDATYGSLSSLREAWLGSLFSPTPHVYSSTDGGQTWRRRDLPPPPGKTWDTVGTGDVLAIYRADVRSLPGTGALAIVRGPAFDEVYYFRSFDAGATWTFVPPAPGELSFVDRTHWWATSSTNLFKTSDAGLTWTVATTELPELFFPQVLDSKHAWAGVVVTGGNGLALTSDGGLHWSLRSVPHPNLTQGQAGKPSQMVTATRPSINAVLSFVCECRDPRWLGLTPPAARSAPRDG